MTTPLEHIFNNVVHVSPKVTIPNQEAFLHIQQEMRRLTEDDDLKIETPPELEENTNTHEQEQLKGVLMTAFCELLNNSPTTTEPLHPGYPFREHIDRDNDLPNQHYPRPYLAIEVNPTTGDPRIIGKEHMTSPQYDEGPLVAQPIDHTEEDFEQEVGRYPFGENAFLNTNFLQALGTLGNRGLAAKGLHIFQLDGERRALK